MNVRELIDDKEKFTKTINERLIEVQREVYRQIEERTSQDEKGNICYKSIKENIEDVDSLMQVLLTVLSISVILVIKNRQKFF